MVTQIKCYVKQNSVAAVPSATIAVAAAPATSVSLQSAPTIDQMKSQQIQSQTCRIKKPNNAHEHPQQTSINIRYNRARASRPIGLIQMCCLAGCRNVATFKAGHGLCHFHLHQAEALSILATAKEGDKDQSRQLCHKDQGGDEDQDKKSTTISDDAIPNIAAFSSSTNRIHSKSAAPSLSINTNDDRDKFVLDLSDVPQQLPIPKYIKRNKNMEKEKGGYSSKYAGVSFLRKSRKWTAQISLNGKLRHLGQYADEVDAAVVYARALLKYKGQAAVDKARAKAGGEEEYLVSSNVVGEKRTFHATATGSRSTEYEKKMPQLYTGRMDLSGVPPQLPIRKRDDKIKEGQSKFVGVHLRKASKRFVASICIKGELLYIGSYGNEEEAGIDYARALFKYKGPEALKRVRKARMHCR